MEDLSNLVFDIKEKLTDGEFKGLMEKMMDLRIKTRLPFEITYIKTKLIQDDEMPTQIEVKPIISKGYGMINESDEKEISDEIEADGVAKVHFNTFHNIMGYKKNCGCCSHSNSFHIRVLDDCEEDMDYNTYFYMVVRIKQMK